MADDIIDQLEAACMCGPLDADGACLLCCARTEIERLRAENERMAESLSNAMRLLSQKAHRGDR